MYRWNEDKNILLKKSRGISFEEVVEEIAKNGVLDNYKHPNSEKYPNQYIYVISYKKYIYYIPYIINGGDIFLKTIIPSRKLQKKYTGGKK